MRKPTTEAYSQRRRRAPGQTRRCLLALLAAALVLAASGCIGASADPAPASPTATSGPGAAPAPTIGTPVQGWPTATARAQTPTNLPRSVPSGPPPVSTRPSATPMPASKPPASPVRLYFPLVSQGDALSAASAPTPTATPTATPVPPTPTPTTVATPTPSGPTVTPVPPATPTPRVKPPPSQYKRLQDYPRPAGDSGYGFHLNGSPYLPNKEVMRTQVIPLLKDFGATWVTVWASSDAEDQLEPARMLVDAGFQVIVRLHDVESPHPNYVPPVRALQRYRSIGVRYFVTGNEPNLTRENPSKAGPEHIARQWVKSADLVKLSGGIPLLYPMSPGGNGDVADNREMLVGILQWLKNNDALDTLDGAGIAIHNRPLGKPLDFRDSTSFLEYEWIDDTVASYAGKHLPLFGTEAGYAFGEQVVPGFPRIDGELHKQYNLAIIAGFRDGRWRDSLFTQTFWMLSGFGHREFLGDWWVENPLNYGKDLPIVEALRGLPKFTRRFQGSGFVARPRP